MNEFIIIRLVLGNLEIAKFSFYLWLFFLSVLLGFSPLSKYTYSSLLFNLNSFLYLPSYLNYLNFLEV